MAPPLSLLEPPPPPPPIVLSIPSSQSHRVDQDHSAVLGFDRHDLERDALRIRTEEEDQVRVIPWGSPSVFCQTKRRRQGPRRTYAEWPGVALATSPRL